MSLFSILKIEEKVITNTSSHFIFNHLPCNLGLTIGHFLKRIIMCYATGYALLAVQIWDNNGIITSQLSTIEGVDIASLLLISKLKQIVFTKKKKDKEINENDDSLFSFTLELTPKEQSVTVKAEDFKISDEKMIIVNPELELFNLSPNCFLKIKIFGRHHFGTVSDDKQKHLFPENDPKNKIIVLSSNYSPIKDGKVFSLIEPLVERSVISLTDEEEKLTLKIETNGSVTPLEVIKESIDKSSELIDLLKNNI